MMDIMTQIYVDSMYDKDIDFFRIKDILDSLSRGQLESKKWAVDKLLPFTETYDECFIIGGWYGLLSHIMAAEGFDKRIVNYDLDFQCKHIGRKLNAEYKNIKFLADDGLNVFFQHDKKDPDHKDDLQNKIVICTACEHIDRDELIYSLKSKHKNTLVCLQSNNFYDVDSHINCSETLEDFIDYLPLSEILCKEQLRWEADNYDRFMVIGR